MRVTVLAAVSAVALVAASASRSGEGASQHGEPTFRGTIAPIDAVQAKRMIGVSWRPGCPVPLRDLRLLTLSHRRFDGQVGTGRLVVHEDVARDVVRVFRRLFAARVPIRRMLPVDAYGASDLRSIEADNTSAFNCRVVEGTRRWSEHAYGRALDLNPIENPYVSGGRTSHPASVPYLDRMRRRPGMAYEGGTIVRAFDAIGWGWGGRWYPVKDYQHFSASGR